MKQNQMQRQSWKRAVLGCGVSLLTALSLSAAGAAAMGAEVMDLRWMNGMAMGILGAAVFAGVLTAGQIPEAAGGMAAFCALLVVINGCMFHFQMSGAGKCIAAIAVGAVPALTLLARKKSRRNLCIKSRLVKLNKKRR